MVHINNEFLNKNFSTTDIFHEEDNYSMLNTVSYDDEIIPISNVSSNNFDKIHFYDQPCAQMDSGTKCSVTNNIDLLWNVKWYGDKHKPHMHMKGATS